jgi:O-succinylbenzoate synthase
MIEENEKYSMSPLSGEELYQRECLLIHVLKSKNLLPQMKPLKINDLFHHDNDLNNYRHSLCLKIKVNPENCLESINLMRKLREINPIILFRLDGNQKFSLEELVTYTKNILKDSKIKNAIDYIEEPLLNFYDSICYLKRSPLLLAVDESALCLLNSDLDKNNFQQSPFVIKPSFIGISPLYHWMNQHQQSRVIISSSYDHPSNFDGLNLLGNLRSDEFHGLSSVF